LGKKLLDNEVSYRSGVVDIKREMTSMSDNGSSSNCIKACGCGRRDTSRFSEKKLNAYQARVSAIASQSHDVHTKVGAILINPKTGAVMAEGYNGFIRGAQDKQLPTSRPQKYDYIIHAETNLICNAVRSGVQTDGAIVYCSLSPCVKCLRMLWQAGVSNFYFKEKYKDFEESNQMLDLFIEIEELDSGFFFMKIRPRKDCDGYSKEGGKTTDV
jgi:dCMP deaminase